MMSEPITWAPSAPIVPKSDPVPSPPSGDAGPGALNVEVSRAADVPVYVYRVLDSGTGRVLVQLPFKTEAQPSDRPGQKVDLST